MTNKFFAVQPTDHLFHDSPDVGEPDCICSRCHKPITKGVAIRAWPEQPTNTEYRFHPECIGMRQADPNTEQEYPI